jgi:hypothetical protein
VWVTGNQHLKSEAEIPGLAEAEFLWEEYIAGDEYEYDAHLTEIVDIVPVQNWSVLIGAETSSEYRLANHPRLRQTAGRLAVNNLR